LTPASALIALRHILEPARSAAFFTDFDGTLSSIVTDPAAAKPVPGAMDSLAGLRGTLGRVTVVSGRPVSFLPSHVPESIDLVGLYGAERRIGGVFETDERVAAWHDPVSAVVAAAAESAPAGMRVEDKGLSLTLHYREVPELEDAVIAWAESQATLTGLVRRGARMSQELHPPVPVDKGSVVTELAEGFDQVVYCGDDAGDLSAFQALTRMRDEGRSVLRVVAQGRGTPREVVELADAITDGPAELVAVLKDLVAGD